MLQQNVTQAPEDSTLPASIEAGSRGTIGSVIFLMPEHDAALTLNLL